MNKKTIKKLTLFALKHKTSIADAKKMYKKLSGQSKKEVDTKLNELYAQKYHEDSHRR